VASGLAIGCRRLVRSELSALSGASDNKSCQIDSSLSSFSFALSTITLSAPQRPTRYVLPFFDDFLQSLAALMLGP
jgi:hypothetical protein